MRAVGKLLLTVAVLLVIAWVGLWWYAQMRMEKGFTAWAAQMATQGYQVAYTADRRGTSPLAATLTVTDLTLTTPADAQGVSGVITLPSLRLRVQALSPLLLHTDLPDRISIDVQSKFDAVVTFGAITVAQQIDQHRLFNHETYPFDASDVTASNINILASQGSLLVLHMDDFVLHGAVDMTAGANQTALNVAESFDGIALSPLVTRLLSIPFDGKIASLAIGLKLSGPVPAGMGGLTAQFRAAQGDPAAQRRLVVPLLHNWAAAYGNGTASVNMLLGPTTLAADGAVTFDAQAQPAGTANLTANHLDQFIAAITDAYPGAQAQIAQIEAKLSPYLTTSDDDGQALQMHVTYGSGAVNINGQKAADLPPVDWNALANPAPPQ